jgi:hypothetical protein
MELGYPSELDKYLYGLPDYYPTELLLLYIALRSEKILYRNEVYPADPT